MFALEQTMQEPCRGNETVRSHFRTLPAPRPQAAPRPNPQQNYLRRAAAVQQAMGKQLMVLKQRAEEAENALNKQAVTSVEIRKEINELETRMLKQFVEPQNFAVEEIAAELNSAKDQRRAFLDLIKTLQTRIDTLDMLCRQLHAECRDRHHREDERLAVLEEKE